MTYFNRRAFMNLSARSLLGLSMRSSITGLPLTFLMRGEARANELNARIDTSVELISSGFTPHQKCERQAGDG